MNGTTMPKTATPIAPAPNPVMEGLGRTTVHSDREIELLAKCYASYVNNLGHASAANFLHRLFTPATQQHILDEQTRQLQTATAPQVLLDLDYGNLTCPYPDCAARNVIKATDQCQRVNNVRINDDHVLVSLEARHFTHTGFHCGACDRPVVFPDGIDIEEN